MRGTALRCTTIPALLFVSAAAQANSYTIVDLGPTYGAAAINDRGVIAGELAARWRDGHWRQLSPSGLAYAINDRGDISGNADNPDRMPWPIVWPRPGKGKPWFLSLPEDATASGQSSAIANNGAVAGYFYTSTGGSHCFFAGDGHTGLDMNWAGGQNGFCVVAAMNDHGQVVGEASNESTVFAFVWKDSHFQILDPLPGTGGASATGVNDHGDIIGLSGALGVVWHDGVPTQVGPSKGYRMLRLASINGNGEIVGFGLPPHNGGDSWVALRYEGTRAVVLSSEVVNPDDWYLSWAVGINDDGVIVGYGDRKSEAPGAEQRVRHAFALYPVR